MKPTNPLRLQHCLQCGMVRVYDEMLPVKGRLRRICRYCISHNEQTLGIQRDSRMVEIPGWPPRVMKGP